YAAAADRAVNLVAVSRPDEADAEPLLDLAIRHPQPHTRDAIGRDQDRPRSRRHRYACKRYRRRHHEANHTTSRSQPPQDGQRPGRSLPDATSTMCLSHLRHRPFTPGYDPKPAPVNFDAIFAFVCSLTPA